MLFSVTSGNNSNRDVKNYSSTKDPFGLRSLPADRNDFQSRVQHQIDVFYNNMGPVLWIMRIMGAVPIRTFPVTQDVSEVLRYRIPLSPIMLWSIFVYASLLTALWFAYNHGFITQLGSQSFDVTVIGYLDLAYHLIDLALPFNNWREAKLMTAYMTSWKHFQLQYHMVTGHVLNVNFRRRAVICIAVLLVVVCVRETIYQVLENNLSNYLVLLTYFYQGALRDIMALTWYFMCLLLRRTAQNLTKSFQKNMDSAVHPSFVIARYKTLWLQFSRLVRQTGTATCYTFSFYVLYLFLMLTVSLYGFISTLAEGGGSRLVYLVCDSVITGTELFIVCDGAGSVTHEVGLRFQGILLDIRQTSISDKTQKEVDAFLRTIDLRPPEINFGGYAVVNRRMLLSLGSMLVTYLVVLLQFQMSNSPASEDTTNTTTTIIPS